MRTNRALLGIVVGAWAFATGCVSRIELGARDGGVIGGRDARVPIAPRTDECGNGLDDDENGRIDDGCPCGPGETQACFTGPVAARRVGGCTDGVQTCDAVGRAEWGNWGDAPCVGGSVPAPEQCDGLDHDCNGALDDGCPCTAGAMRACGTAFAIVPCRAGTQTCIPAGTWSACADAVGPMADVCDGMDNDCDGDVDEGCGCMPEPEICGDGVDNDCDGVTDEAACTTRPDAGVADGGGTCVPTTEACDGVDNDCDGTIDNGVCDACRCDYWGTATASATIPMANGFGMSPARFRNFEVAFDGDGALAFVTGGDIGGRRDGRISFALRRTDGGAIGTDRTLSPSGAAIVGVAWSGSRWIAAWNEVVGSTPSAVVVAIASDGTMAAGPVRLDRAATAITAVGDEVYVVVGGGAAGAFVRRLDAALAPVGAPIALALVKDPFDIRAVGDAVAVVGPGEPGTTMYMALIRSGALVNEVDLQRTGTTYVGTALGRSFVAQDADGILPCWLGAGGISCRYVSPADGRALGPAFIVSLDTTASWDVVRASCSMALMTGLAGSGSVGRFIMNHFDTSGTVDTKTIDRLWVQPRQTMRLFAADDGRLLRVADASLSDRGDGLLDVLVSTLRCREAPPPVTDCSALQRTACSYACTSAPCVHSGTECMVNRGDGSGYGFAASRCDIIDCSRIDAPSCQEALAEPQRCVGDENGWLIPADCAMPP